MLTRFALVGVGGHFSPRDPEILNEPPVLNLGDHPVHPDVMG